MAVLCLILAVCIFATGFQYWRDRRLLKRLDHMLESAMSGEFTESEYTESMLSRLEARMYQYLSLDRQDRKKAAAERDSVKTLVSDISHQTKTPVANILLYAQLLLEDPDLDDRARQIAGQIEQQTEKLNFLIQSLIRTSRLENGIVAVVPKENRIRELIEGIACPAEAGEKGVGLGLYLAREILEREGGYIKAESRPGEGSVFSVFLSKGA